MGACAAAEKERLDGVLSQPDFVISVCARDCCKPKACRSGDAGVTRSRMHASSPEGPPSGQCTTSTGSGASSPSLSSTSSSSCKSAFSPGPKERAVDSQQLSENVFRTVVKVQTTVLQVVQELTAFRTFARENFPSFGEAFAAIAGFAHHVNECDFIENVEGLGFSGDSKQVFYAMVDDRHWDQDFILTRRTFIHRLSTMGKHLVLSFLGSVKMSKDQQEFAIKMEARIEKQKRTVLAHEVPQKRALRRFLEPRYTSPGRAFDAISGYEKQGPVEAWQEALKKFGFLGDSRTAFYVLCDASGNVQRDHFINALACTFPKGIRKPSSPSLRLKSKTCSALVGDSGPISPLQNKMKKCQTTACVLEDFPTEVSPLSRSRDRGYDKKYSLDSASMKRIYKKVTSQSSMLELSKTSFGSHYSKPGEMEALNAMETEYNELVKLARSRSFGNSEGVGYEEQQANQRNL